MGSSEFASFAFTACGRRVVIRYLEKDGRVAVIALDMDFEKTQMKLRDLALTGIKIPMNGVVDEKTLAEAMEKVDVKNRLVQICWAGNRTELAYMPDHKPVEIKPSMVYTGGSVAFTDYGRLVVILYVYRGKREALVDSPETDFKVTKMKLAGLALTGITINMGSIIPDKKKQGEAIEKDGIISDKKRLVKAIKKDDVKKQLRKIFNAGNGNV